MEARNQLGYSEFSETITLLCAYIPFAPISVSTEILATDVVVSWELDSDNGSPITAYKVFIKEISSGTYTLESSDCVSDTTVVSNR